MRHELASRGMVLTRWVKRPLWVFLVALMALTALAIVERSQPTPLSSADIARRLPVDQFRSVFGASQPAAPASPVALPPAVAGPAQVQAQTPPAALAQANQVADNAVVQASAAHAAARAAEHFPPFVTGVVCPILLQARAQVISTIDALIATFPALAPQLNAVKASALATINAQLEQFHCPIS